MFALFKKLLKLRKITFAARKLAVAVCTGTDENHQKASEEFERLIIGLKLNLDEASLVYSYLYLCPGFRLTSPPLKVPSYRINFENVDKILFHLLNDVGIENFRKVAKGTVEFSFGEKITDFRYRHIIDGEAGSWISNVISHPRI